VLDDDVSEVVVLSVLDDDVSDVVVLSVLDDVSVVVVTVDVLLISIQVELTTVEVPLHENLYFAWQAGLQRFASHDAMSTVPSSIG
jgi:hypothetical protein